MTKTNSQIKDEISSIFVKWSLPTRQIAINEIIKLLDSLLKTQREEDKKELVEKVKDLLKTPVYNKDQTYDIAIKEVLSIMKEQ